MTIDYATLPIEELLKGLERASAEPALYLIQACLDRREEATPGLLKMLEQFFKKQWTYEDPRRFAPVHAGLLLMAFREPAALPIFQTIFRSEAQKIYTLVEWFSTELAAYGPTAVPFFLEVLGDPNAFEFARSTTIDILTSIAVMHPETREQVVTGLRAQLPPLQANGTVALGTTNKTMLTWIADGLLTLRDTTSVPQIQALYKQDAINTFFLGSLKDYLQRLQTPVNPDEIRVPQDVITFYQERQATQKKRAAQAAKALSSKPKSSAPAHTTRTAAPRKMKSETLLRTQPKIGRNDLCPCGSGRKYKHCCGKS